jgi:hypothetical protein
MVVGLVNMAEETSISSTKGHHKEQDDSLPMGAAKNGATACDFFECFYLPLFRLQFTKQLLTTVHVRNVPTYILVQLNAKTVWMSAADADALLQMQAVVQTLSNAEKEAVEEEIRQLLPSELLNLYRCAVDREVKVVMIQPRSSNSTVNEGDHMAVTPAAQVDRVTDPVLSTDFSISRKPRAQGESGENNWELRKACKTRMLPIHDDEQSKIATDFGEPLAGTGSIRKARLAADSALEAARNQYDKHDDLEATYPFPSLAAGLGRDTPSIARTKISQAVASTRHELICILQNDMLDDRERSGSVAKARIAAAKALEEALYLSRLQRFADAAEHLKQPGSVRNALDRLPQRVEEDALKSKPSSWSNSSIIRHTYGHESNAKSPSTSTSSEHPYRTAGERGSVGNALDHLEQRRANEPLSLTAIAARRPQHPPRLASLPRVSEGRTWHSKCGPEAARKDLSTFMEETQNQSRPCVSNPLLPHPKLHLRGGAPSSTYPAPLSVNACPPATCPAASPGTPIVSRFSTNSLTTLKQAPHLLKRVSSMYLGRSNRNAASKLDLPAREDEHEDLDNINGVYLGYWGGVLGVKKVRRMSIARLDEETSDS